MKTNADKLEKTREDLDLRFAYHPPGTPRVAESHGRVRSECRDFADMLTKLVPSGRELSCALTKLEEVMMWANAGIARNQWDANQMANEFFENE